MSPTQMSENSNGAAPASEKLPTAEGEPGRASLALCSTAPAAKSDQKEATRTEQAEILADQLAMKVAMFTSVVGRRLFRFVARLREEAEDVWAEAQTLRRKQKK